MVDWPQEFKPPEKSDFSEVNYVLKKLFSGDVNTKVVYSNRNIFLMVSDVE
jgi:hypothetical protein